VSDELKCYYDAERMAEWLNVFADGVKPGEFCAALRRAASILRNGDEYPDVQGTFTWLQTRVETVRLLGLLIHGLAPGKHRRQSWGRAVLQRAIELKQAGEYGSNGTA
jgi:hypothetical protein